MTRVTSATTNTAIAQNVTRPIHLVRMGWETEVRAATWDTAISWNSESWIASGINATNIDSNGGTLWFPDGDDDPWKALVVGENTRDRTIEVYEYHTNYTVSPIASDATLIFSGLMDSWSLSNGISVTLIENLQSKHFPPTSISRGTYTYLLPKGTRLQWGNDVIVVG